MIRHIRPDKRVKNSAGHATAAHAGWVAVALLSTLGLMGSAAAQTTLSPRPTVAPAASEQPTSPAPAAAPAPGGTGMPSGVAAPAAHPGSAVRASATQPAVAAARSAAAAPLSAAPVAPTDSAREQLAVEESPLIGLSTASTGNPSPVSGSPVSAAPVSTPPGSATPTSASPTSPPPGNTRLTGQGPIAAPPAVGSGAATTQPVETAARSGSPLDATEIQRGSASPADPSNKSTTAADAAAPSVELPRIALALTAVIGLIFLLRWGSRKMFALPSNAGNAHLMQVVSRTSLSPRQQMLLVRVGRRLVMIGDSGGRLSSLGQIEDPDEVAQVLGQVRQRSSSSSAGVGGPTFSALVKKLNERFRGVPTSASSEDDTEDADQSAWNGEADLPPANRADERRHLLVGLHDGGHDTADDEDTAEGAEQTVSLRGGTESGSGEELLKRRGLLDDKQEPVGLTEEAARTAVETAREDIRSLRARLQQVTRRLAEPDNANEAGG